MKKAGKSLNRDKLGHQSRISDSTLAIPNVLRQARLRGQLTQQELAAKLGLRQRQISDLERATIDPRLSTVQNVARALDLEVIVISRHLISAVEALQRAGSGAGKRPLYALSEDDTPGAANDRPHQEVGDTSDLTGSTEHSPRQRKEREP
jgi:HTH-type transcriptional regulator / antitoxin HipB